MEFGDSYHTVWFNEAQHIDVTVSCLSLLVQKLKIKHVLPRFGEKNTRPEVAILKNTIPAFFSHSLAYLIVKVSNYLN